jgi:predicted DNA-binding transcriptional regulator AlpA
MPRKKSTAAVPDIAALPHSALLDAEKVAAVISRSPQTLWRWVRAGTFPKPHIQRAGYTVWRVEDIRLWLESARLDTLIQQRRADAPREGVAA